LRQIALPLLRFIPQVVTSLSKWKIAVMAGWRFNQGVYSAKAFLALVLKPATQCGRFCLTHCYSMRMDFFREQQLYSFEPK
jgi:hypothetical protein